MSFVLRFSLNIIHSVFAEGVAPNADSGSTGQRQNATEVKNEMRAGCEETRSAVRGLVKNVMRIV